jgi:predicted nucleic acid-binding protein
LNRLVADARRAVSQIETNAVMLGDPVDPEPIIRDPNDDYIVALARKARVPLIVAADKDLLEHRGLVPPAVSLLEICELLYLIQPV